MDETAHQKKLRRRLNTWTDGNDPYEVRSYCVGMLQSGEAERLRIKMGISRRDFAAEIGASASAVDRWFRGLRQPDAKTAEQLGMELALLELMASWEDQLVQDGGHTTSQALTRVARRRNPGGEWKTGE